MLKSVTAYIIASFFGATVYRVMWFLLHGNADDFWGMVTLNAGLIFIFVLPFWALFLVVSKISKVNSLFIYILAGAVIGGIIEPVLFAAFPESMLDSGPDRGYFARLNQIYLTNGFSFIAMGILSSALYWLIVRPNTYK